MTSYIPIFLLIVLALFGMPLFAVIVAGAMLGFHYSGVDLMAVAIELYRIADTPILLALPLFTTAGYILGETNTSRRLVRLTKAFLGWMPNGLAIVSFVTCALFTAFTGASGVTIVALGALLYPALVESGYKKDFSLGLVTTSGSLGLLFPPSVPLIIYGIIAQQMDVGRSVTITGLFLAGILPGLLMVAVLSIYSLWTNRNSPLPLTGFSWPEAKSAVREAIWEIPLPIFLLAGIYGGYFAISEAAAVTALYVVIVEVFVYKEIKPSKLPAVLRDSMVMVGGVLLILGVALAFTNFLIDVQVPMKLFEIMQARVTSKFVFLILLNILLLVLGAILDIFSALVIMVPLILPVAVSYGIDPVHLGVIFLANMQIGYFTPPVGMNLFIASYRFDKPVTELYRASAPFMFVLLFAVLVITYWPALSLVFLK
ncbi:MAG: TRAP transporter large permease subunit [Pseudomonadota bacterium]